ncbi:MAG TPA: hypothetical protein VH395_07450 [Jatrophihabitantaceae bacterium]
MLNVGNDPYFSSNAEVVGASGADDVFGAAEDAGDDVGVFTPVPGVPVPVEPLVPALLVHAEIAATTVITRASAPVMIRFSARRRLGCPVRGGGRGAAGVDMGRPPDVGVTIYVLSDDVNHQCAQQRWPRRLRRANLLTCSPIGVRG